MDGFSGSTLLRRETSEIFGCLSQGPFSLSLPLLSPLPSYGGERSFAVFQNETLQRMQPADTGLRPSLDLYDV